MKLTGHMPPYFSSNILYSISYCLESLALNFKRNLSHRIFWVTEVVFDMSAKVNFT